VFSQKKFEFCVQAYSPPSRPYCLDPFTAGRVEAQAPEEGGSEGQQRGRGWRRRPPLWWSTGGGTTRISSGGDAESVFLTSAHRCSCPRRPSWNSTEGGRGLFPLLRQPSPLATCASSLSPKPLLSPPPCAPSSGDQVARPASSAAQPALRSVSQLGGAASSRQSLIWLASMVREGGTGRRLEAEGRGCSDRAPPPGPRLGQCKFTGDSNDSSYRRFLKKSD
jgi:hypothetical protein